MTAFFIPGVDGERSIESAYLELRKEVEAEHGRPPRSKRIFSLFSRRGRLDCVTEVGLPDPLSGDTVIAIFDMGPQRPFIVCRQQQPGSQDGIREIIESSAYTVMEFDA